MNAAIELIRYFDAMRARVTATLSRDASSPAATRIVAWLRRNARTRFSRAELRSDLRRTLGDFERDAALKELESRGAIRPYASPPRPGRKPSEAYEVHPDLLAAPPGDVDSPNRLPHSAASEPIPVIPVIPGAPDDPRERQSA